MKKGISWILLSFLLVAALVLASCGEAEPGEQEEEEEEPVGEQEEEEEEEEEPVGEQEEEEEAAVGEPQYGGTVYQFLWSSEPGQADQTKSSWPAMQFCGPVLEFLLKGDAEKYGARGTDEFPFTEDDIPVEYSTGAVAESWEITPDRDKLIFHIRPGIIWAAYGKEHVMEPRELTAEDVAWSLNRAIDGNTRGSGALRTEKGGWIDSIYALDDTVIFETSKFVPFSIDWRNLANGSGVGIYAPETVEAGVDDWNNLVGTGPFMFKERVVGSHVSYERNPNYWDTTTINGVVYDDIPFIDEFVYVGVPDFSTRIAALRTGKLDVFYTVPMDYVDTISQTNPEIIQEAWSMSRLDAISLRCDRPPFDNHEVRRAMMIALDLKAIARAVVGFSDIWGWPAGTTTAAYTPRDELPVRTRELYDYDPVKAKQILADEGYPDGFGGVEITIPPYSAQTEVATMIVAYWADIGVEATMKVMQEAALAALAPGVRDCTTVGIKTSLVLASLKNLYIMPNNAFYDNPEFTELYLKAESSRDEAEQNLLLKEPTIMALDSVAYIPIWNSDTRVSMWWPWLKNFYGEFAIGSWQPSYAMSTAWIDQDLKAEMGY